jgi:hypothetical protein
MKTFTTHRILTLLFFSIITGSSFATGTEAANSFLSGKITDAKTGKPLAGASIILHEAKTGTVSDETGPTKHLLFPRENTLLKFLSRGILRYWKP